MATNVPASQLVFHSQSLGVSYDIHKAHLCINLGSPGQNFKKKRVKNKVQQIKKLTSKEVKLLCETEKNLNEYIHRCETRLQQQKTIN